jgi:hypothetical protein
MLDRLILSAVLGVAGFSGLFPEPPTPMTLQQKAKDKSVSQVCEKKKKSKQLKKLCERWGKHE